MYLTLLESYPPHPLHPQNKQEIKGRKQEQANVLNKTEDSSLQPPEGPPPQEVSVTHQLPYINICLFYLYKEASGTSSLSQPAREMDIISNRYR